MLGVGGFFVYRFFFGGPPPDLQLVPGDATGFVSLRVADVWNTEAVKKLLEKLPPDAKSTTDQVEKATGLSLADIERVTVVWRDFKDKPDYVVVATAKPYDRAKVLDLGFGVKPEESKVGGRSYYLHPMVGAIAPVTDRVFIVGEAEAVKKLLGEPERRKVEGPLAEAINLAAAGKHHLVGAVRANPKIKELAEAGDFDTKAAVEFQTVTVLGNLGDALDLEVRLAYPDEPKAVAGKKNAEDLMGTVRVAVLPTLRKRPGKSGVKLADQLGEVLNSAKVEQKGPNVTLTAHVDVVGLVNVGGEFLGMGPPH
jgi:hypothetical protein